MQILENGIEVPTNSDPYNLTADLAKMGNTTKTITSVANQAARDAITKYPGLAVIRLDKPGAPIEVWNGSTWRLQPIIEIGQGNSAPILKSGEVAVTLNAFLVGVINFPTPFPTKLVSINFQRRHTTAGAVTFTLIDPDTTRSAAAFVASGATASSVIYVTYQAWGY